MYNLSEIKALHLETTSKCQASCPMCARNIQGGIDNPFMTIAEIDLETFKKWFSVDFIKQLDKLYMCGNLGDPMIAKDTAEIFAYCRDLNPSMHLSMNTNGGARGREFWERLAELNVTVRFGIDGLVDTNHLYRKGVSYDNVMKNTSAFIHHGGYAIWDMLIFEHNQHQVEDCARLSDIMGFKEFHSKHTSRFKEESLAVLDKDGKPMYRLFSTDRSKNIQQAMSKQSENITINCKVAKEKNLYVTSTGNVTPCCWLDMEWMPHNSPGRMDYMEKIGEHMNLNKYSLEEVFDSQYFNKIQDTWRCSPLKECSKQCGSYDRFNEQFQ